MPKRLNGIKTIINSSELARRMNVTTRYVTYLLTGKRTNVKRLHQIRRILHNEFKEIL